MEIDAGDFFKHVLAFPCFKDAGAIEDAGKLLQIVFDAYEGDNLTEEQELVVDLYVHLHHAGSQFDLKRALDTWGMEDRAALVNLIQSR